MSKANDIAEAIKARIETIRTANGYATDIGQTVHRGRRQLETPDTATLYEGEEDASKPRAVPYTATAIINFTIEACAHCDPDNPDIAGHILIADIQRAVFSDDNTLSGLLSETIQYAGRVIQPRIDGQSIVNVQVRLQATYTLTPATP
jgi:hypothetical protein